MKKKTQTAIGMIAGAVMTIGLFTAASPAYAEESQILSGISCTSGRKVFSNSKSAAGYVYHDQFKDNTVWSKSWTNTSVTYRTYSKGFTSISTGWIYAEVDLITANLSCVA